MLKRVGAIVLLTAAACGSPRPRSDDDSRRRAENTDALCANGIDDDNNGFADCDDLLCRQSAQVSVCRLGAENSRELCHDQQDNDSDGRADCADPDCEAFGCFETSDAACTNQLDDDEDGYADCDDFDCRFGCNVTVCGGPSEKTEQECTDGTDNDGDRFVDCADFGCRDCVPACQAGTGENTVGLCTDRQDNDNDGATDCRDTECWRLEGVTGCNTGVENTPELCANGIDDDNDPFIDCTDRNCSGIGDCVEDTPARCADGEDNDGDGYTDCQDFDCDGQGECGENSDAECSNGQDDDGNGYTDCADFSCLYGCDVTVCPGPEKSEADCADNIDNDGDNRIDCADRGCRDCIAACAAGTGENTVALCTNGADDDGDRGIDCRDTECVSLAGVSGCDTGAENTAALCADGIDNDNDPWIDCADRNCRGLGPCVENTDALCADALDNDADGFVDCDDFDCARNAAVTVCGTPRVENTDALCRDALDNDSDGFTDCDDRDCSNNPALTVCPPAIDATIERIQNRAHPQAVVIPTGQSRVRVRLANVVVTTPVMTDRNGNRSFFVQEAFPPADVRWRGIEVFAGSADPGPLRPGDVIELVGFYAEYFGLSQIQWGRHTASASAVPGPLAVETQQLATADGAEPYEGVLIEVGVPPPGSTFAPAVRVVAVGVPSRGGATPRNDDFSVLEASAPATLTPLVVGTHFAPLTPEVGQRFGFIRGPLTYTWSQYRLAPRAAADYGPSEAPPDDADGDGLTDADETRLGTNPALADTDGDGTDDRVEVVDVSLPADGDCDGKLDAVESDRADSDGDGVVDEVDPFDWDGPDADPDGDGMPNSVDVNDDGDELCDAHITAVQPNVCTRLGDNCDSVANDDQANLDRDAFGDACDPDVDADDWCNPSLCTPIAGHCSRLGDNCAAVANPDQTDTDADRAGDACDPDDDGDGVCDPGEVAAGVCVLVGGEPDNCPLVPNGTQADNENDNRGDVCDPDDDNDGVCDPGVQEGTEGCTYVAARADNCPFVVNPGQEDADGDGVGDACQVAAVGPPEPGQVLINEVLADPNGAPAVGNGVPGDANGDGTMGASNDEFVELVNVSGRAVSLAGCVIRDLSTIRHRFEGAPDPGAYVLPHRSAAVVFGGGTPTGTFAGAAVFTASTGLLGLNNGAHETERVTLICPAAAGGELPIATMSYAAEGNSNQSLTLSIQGSSAGTYVLHTELAPGVPFSPGGCADGAPFSACLD